MISEIHSHFVICMILDFQGSLGRMIINNEGRGVSKSG
jgi:hypothetical protein